ncbi:MAG: BrnT family toxin [Polaromonas sp.]
MHNNYMEVTFDPVKNASNVQDRCLPFTLVEQLDWAGAVVEEDIRKAYGERRFRVLGFIGERLHAVVFTPRAGKMHVISLRKANPREVKRYAKTPKS